MTIARMTELYRKGAYSPINYYLGLLELIKEGADLDLTMGEVPERLLRKMIDMARRHRDSGNEADSQDLAIAKQITEWDERCLRAVGPRRGAAPFDPQSIVRLRSSHGLSLQSFALALDVSTEMVTAWEQGVKKPSRSVQRKLEALRVDLEKPRIGRRVASAKKKSKPIENPTKPAGVRRQADGEDATPKRPLEEGGNRQGASRPAAEKRREAGTGRSAPPKTKNDSSGGERQSRAARERRAEARPEGKPGGT